MFKQFERDFLIERCNSAEEAMNMDLLGILTNYTSAPQGVVGELDEIEAIFRVFSKIRRSGGTRF